MKDEKKTNSNLAAKKAAVPVKKTTASKADKPAAPKVAAVKKPAAKTSAPKVSSPKASSKATTKAAFKKQVLFVGSEATPFAGTGGLAEVLGSLPKAINALNSNVEASVVLPLYGEISDDVRAKLEFICHINVPLAWRNQYCGLLKMSHDGVTIYFVDNEYYFKRASLYGCYDDAERFAFFSRAVCELIPYFTKKPDILHCHDWQTALVPIYYKLFYMYRSGFENIKTAFTIHNIEYQGKFGKNILEDVFGINLAEYHSLGHEGSINLVKAAMDYSDILSTVSPSYAKELEDAFYAHGLEKVVTKNRNKMRGILNGVDVDSYNPETNFALFAKYSVKDKKNKAVNKAELQGLLNLPQKPDVPVVAIISRLVSHKGLDLIRFAIDDILKMNMQLVVLGTGEPGFEDFFTTIANIVKEKCATHIGFNRDLAHKVYAGADIFLMPSKSEPCGLSQMMACRYGTVPIVRATGGLKDSIIDCEKGEQGNGFVFSDYDAGQMIHALSRAVGLYKDYPKQWEALVTRCMLSDFSWKASAKEYVKLYE